MAKKTILLDGKKDYVKTDIPLITRDIDWNTLTTTGWYLMCDTQGKMGPNAAPIYPYGHLLVVTLHENHTMQLYIPHAKGDGIYTIATRYKWNSAWEAWRVFYADKEG